MTRTNKTEDVGEGGCERRVPVTPREPSPTSDDEGLV